MDSNTPQAQELCPKFIRNSKKNEISELAHFLGPFSKLVLNGEEPYPKTGPAKNIVFSNSAP